MYEDDVSEEEETPAVGVPASFMAVPTNAGTSSLSTPKRPPSPIESNPTTSSIPTTTTVVNLPPLSSTTTTAPVPKRTDDEDEMDYDAM